MYCPWFDVLDCKSLKHPRDFIDSGGMCHFTIKITVHGFITHLNVGVFFVCPGSPFLASEDRVLGGVIVLRCCRCVEAPPSQNIQGILGKTPTISSQITVKLLATAYGWPRSGF